MINRISTLSCSEDSHCRWGFPDKERESGGGEEEMPDGRKIANKYKTVPFKIKNIFTSGNILFSDVYFAEEQKKRTSLCLNVNLFI